jgi:hypothetical protein
VTKIKTIFIVGCGATKRTAPAPAADLYLGPLYSAALGYARKCAPDYDIRILSAKHGLLDLDAIVAPYNTRWSDSDAMSVYKLTKQLEYEWRTRTHFVMLCAAPYCTRFLDAYREHYKAHAQFQAPLQGLGIGEQISWLKTAAKGVQS